MGWPGGDFSSRIEVEQLAGHLLKRGPRLVALGCPAFAAKRMEPGRRRIFGDICGRAIPLDLVDTVERDVESVTALILDHRDFYSAFSNEQALDATIDADAVLEMDYEI